MPTSTFDVAALGERATALGFSSLRITNAGLPPLIGERLRNFVDAGHAGSMDWLADTSRRPSPQLMWPEARSAVVVAMNYGQGIDALARLEDKSAGVISIYALHRDYHEIIKGKLKHLAAWLARVASCDVKVFVDTAPLMEKPLAAQAGLGWQGKHTNLVSRELGSWFFLGVILASVELPQHEAEADHCGTCSACLDVCPTKAFPEPRVLDARRCISYLTIEHKGHIAREFRKPMANRIYGCDDCLAVCPWNKFAQQAQEVKLLARPDLLAPRLHHLLALDDPAFRELFAGSPVKRIGRNRFIRNCLIAAGNSADATLVPIVKHLLHDESPLVRAMAVWALLELAGDDEARAYVNAAELDHEVRAEWEAA